MPFYSADVLIGADVQTGEVAIYQFLPPNKDQKRDRTRHKYSLIET